jgi:hypothetical protein
VPLKYPRSASSTSTKTLLRMCCLKVSHNKLQSIPG